MRQMRDNERHMRIRIKGRQDTLCAMRGEQRLVQLHHEKKETESSNNTDINGDVPLRE